MSDQEQVKIVPVTQETVAKRPLGGLAEPQFLELLRSILNKAVELDPKHEAFSEELVASFQDILNRVQWTTERMLAYEGNLLGLVDRCDTIELESLMKQRYEVLYYLFKGENKDLTNKELIERIQGRWKRADTITIEVDPNEEFNPIKLMSAFASELRNYSIDVSKKDAEPEMILQTGRGSEVRRFVNFDWIEWYLKKHEGKAVPEDAISFAVDQLKVQMFGSVSGAPKDTTISVDRDKRDPEIIFEQLVKRRI